MGKGTIPAALALVLGASGIAHANPEPVALYDARSVGMGGTGLAFIDNASAVFHNPANLELVDRGSATLVLTPFLPVVEAPFAGRNTAGRSVQEPNSARVAPLFFGGAAGRLHDRVVVGLGAYLSTGVGSQFDEVDAFGGEPMDLEFAAGEFSLPVSVRLNDELSMGMALRLMYAVHHTDVYDPERRGRVEQNLNGFGFPGFRVGVLYDPTDAVNLALTYRSSVTVELRGTTEVENTAFPDEALPTRSDWRVPHAVRLGGAYSLLQARLLFAFEMKLQFHTSANARQVYRVDVSGTDLAPLLGSDETEQVVPLDWRDTLSFLMGAEYRIRPWLPVRIGYSLGISATPRHRANPFMPPPGLLQAINAGAGVCVGNFDVDLGGSYAFGEATIDHESPTGAPGRYETDAFFLSLSLSYRI